MDFMLNFYFPKNSPSHPSLKMHNIQSSLQFNIFNTKSQVLRKLYIKCGWLDGRLVGRSVGSLFLLHTLRPQALLNFLSAVNGQKWVYYHQQWTPTTKCTISDNAFCLLALLAVVGSHTRSAPSFVCQKLSMNLRSYIWTDNPAPKKSLKKIFYKIIFGLLKSLSNYSLHRRVGKRERGISFDGN